MAWRQLRSISGLDQLCSFSVGTVVQSSLIRHVIWKPEAEQSLFSLEKLFLAAKAFTSSSFFQKAVPSPQNYILKKNPKKRDKPRMATTSQPPRGKTTCKKVFWAVFPHACFILSLVIYAFLGALMFSHIEGTREVTESEEYRMFLRNLTFLARRLSGMYWNFKMT